MTMDLERGGKKHPRVGNYFFFLPHNPPPLPLPSSEIPGTAVLPAFMSCRTCSYGVSCACRHDTQFIVSSRA